MKNRIINKKSFFGFTFYKRVCLYEKKIEYKETSRKFKYAGLYALSVFKDFNYDFISYKEDKDWDDLAIDTICTSFFSLLFNQNIEIIFFEDEVSVFYKKTKKSIEGFYFKSLNSDHIKSKYLENIYRLIVNSEIKHMTKNSIKHVVTMILDFYIGGYQKRKLEKKFIIRVISDVTYLNDWISIKTIPKYLGFVNKYQFELSDEIKVEIKEEYEEIEKLMTSLMLENKMFAIYTKKIKKIITREFFNREHYNVS